MRHEKEIEERVDKTLHPEKAVKETKEEDDEDE